MGYASQHEGPLRPLKTPRRERDARAKGNYREEKSGSEFFCHCYVQDARGKRMDYHLSGSGIHALEAFAPSGLPTAA